MKIPRGLSKEDKKLYKRLFANLRPRNEIEVEAAKRYIYWFKLHQIEQLALAKSDTVIFINDGKTQAQSYHLKNLQAAEGELRRLWQQLQPAMIEPQEDDTDLGQFGGL